MPNSNEKFQPQQHLVQRDGAKYLPLKWRLAWLRSEHPDAQISTRLVSHQDGIALFRATIKLPNGGSAASWGARSRLSGESEQDLTYISEAENQALERALTMLGYGTEYNIDFDVPTEQEGFALEVLTLPEPSRLTPVSNTPAIPSQTAPTPISRNVKPNVPAHEEQEEDEPELLVSSPELEDNDEDEDEDDEDEVEETPRPNLRPVGGRQTPPRSAAPVTPLPTTPRNQPTTPTPVSRPTPTPRTTVTPAPVPASTGVANQAVLDRVRGIDDPALVLLIKQIYHEARRLYGLNEESVDMRSQRSYKLPANELNQEQAEEFLEKIKSGARRNQQ